MRYSRSVVEPRRQKKLADVFLEGGNIALLIPTLGRPE